MVPRALGALPVTVVDARLKLRDHLLKRGAQCVIGGLRQDIRPGCHEMCRDPEGRAGFGPALDEHARLVDLKSFAQRFDVPFDERGEGCGRLMMLVLENEFHNGASIAS